MIVRVLFIIWMLQFCVNNHFSQNCTDRFIKKGNEFNNIEAKSIDSALFYYLKAIQCPTSKLNDKKSQLTAFNRIFEIYDLQNIGYDSLKLANEYLNLSNELQDTSHIIFSLYAKGRRTKNTDEGVRLIKKGIVLQKNYSGNVQTNGYQVLGSYYLDKLDGNKALKSFFQAIENTSNPLAKISIFHSIYNAYIMLNEPKKVIEYSDSVINIANRHDTIDRLILMAYYSKSSSLFQPSTRNLKLADSINSILIDLAKLQKDDFVLAYAYENKSFYHYLMGEFNLALEFNQKSLSFFKKIGLHRAVVNGILNDITQFYKTEKYQLALNKIKELDIYIDSLQADSLHYIVKRYWFSYLVFKANGNTKLALNDYETYIAYKDKLTTIENKEEALTQELQFKHKQELLADSLQHQKEIEIKDLVVINQKKQTNYIIFGLAGGFILLGLIGVLFYIKRKNKLEKEKAQIEQEALILNQKMLRSQLNPHFLSNSLGAIQNFILKNDKLVASDYLAKFSKLTRLILESSREETIPLEDEIKIIDLYLSFQKLRLGNQFDYKIVVDENIDVEDEKIPPMLLQPFIENAVEHGLKNTNNGLVEVFIKKAGVNMEILIKDNGDGIKNKQHNKERKSYSTTITKERIESIEKRSNKKISLSFISNDLNANLPGTIVKFIIPSFV